jgi:hypothetical protein
MMPRGRDVQMLKTLSRQPLGSIPSGLKNVLGLREPGKSMGFRRLRTKAEGCSSDYGTFVYSRTCCRR